MKANLPQPYPVQCFVLFYALFALFYVGGGNRKSCGKIRPIQQLFLPKRVRNWKRFKVEVGVSLMVMN